MHQPFVPVASVLRFRYAGLAAGNTWVNSFAVQYAGTVPDATALSALATTLRGLWNTHLAALYVTTSSLQSTTVWDISSETGASGVNSTTAVGTTAAANPLPMNAAVAVSWPIQIRYRGGHPRTYLLARNGGDVTGQKVLGTAYHDAIVAAFTAWRGAVNATALGGANLTLGAVHYLPPRTVPKTAGQFYSAGIPVVHGRLDTQRRRLGKETA